MLDGEGRRSSRLQARTLSPSPGHRPGPAAAVRACCPTAVSAQRRPASSRGSRLAGSRGCGLRSRVLAPPLLAESAARRPMSAAPQDAAAAAGAAGNDDELDDDEFTDSVSSEPGHAPVQGRRTGAVAIRFCCWSPLDPSPPQANVSRPRCRPQDEAPPAENCMELEFETDDEARPIPAAHPASLYVPGSLSLSLLWFSPLQVLCLGLCLSRLCLSPSASLHAR